MVPNSAAKTPDDGGRSSFHHYASHVNRYDNVETGVKLSRPFDLVPPERAECPIAP